MEVSAVLLDTAICGDCGASGDQPHTQQCPQARKVELGFKGRSWAGPALNLKAETKVAK